MNSFKEDQLKFPRVKGAYDRKEKQVRQLFEKLNIKMSESDIFIRAFKEEAILEVWAKNKGDDKFQLIKNYEVCSKSGTLGPKRKQGDFQVPEGFYYVDRFNPASNYHLSLGLNYPNQSDRILSDKHHPGGDIFIHGNCVTIGCLPLTDALIEELYIMAVEARSGGQNRIPVHIFPFKMSRENLRTFLTEQRIPLTGFWNNLAIGYEFFEKSKVLPRITVDPEGNYQYTAVN